ncbi:MAG: hypothetical protein WD355_08865 [Balneolaceae bacterium]
MSSYLFKYIEPDIEHGQYSKKVFISDIASTVSVFLNSPFPSGNIGNPLNDLLKR